MLFDYSADRAETEYPDTESLQLESGKPLVFRPVKGFKMGPVAVQFRVKSEISRIASMKIDHFRTFFRARFLLKMADLRLRKLKSRVVTRDFRQLHLNRPHAVGIEYDLDFFRHARAGFILTIILFWVLSSIFLHLLGSFSFFGNPKNRFSIGS